MAQRKTPLLRQSIATEVLLPRASIETNTNYSLEVRQQYPIVQMRTLWPGEQDIGWCNAAGEVTWHNARLAVAVET